MFISGFIGTFILIGYMYLILDKAAPGNHAKLTSRVSPMARGKVDM
jgi:hypothetical protein